MSVAGSIETGMSALWRRMSLLAPLVALVGCDHATKYVAKIELQDRPPRHLLRPLLDLRYVENTDVAFNTLRWIPEGTRARLLLVTGALGVLLLAGLLLRWPKTKAVRASLVLILAGALGNYLDRLLRGYVVDFVHVPHWPVFNVADICVTAGAVLLIWTTLRTRGHQPAGPTPSA